MSFVKSTIVAGALTLAMLSPAAAQNPEPWDIRERTAYVVMMDGRTMSVSLNDRAMSTLMRSAKRVPGGTVLIKSGGQLYMVNARKVMFDREGNWMAMGGGG
jgi:hypothetical protein